MMARKKKQGPWWAGPTLFVGIVGAMLVAGSFESAAKKRKREAEEKARAEAERQANLQGYMHMMS